MDPEKNNKEINPTERIESKITGDSPVVNVDNSTTVNHIYNIGNFVDGDQSGLTQTNQQSVQGDQSELTQTNQQEVQVDHSGLTQANPTKILNKPIIGAIILSVIRYLDLPNIFELKESISCIINRGSEYLIVAIITIHIFTHLLKYACRFPWNKSIIEFFGVTIFNANNNLNNTETNTDNNED